MNEHDSDPGAKATPAPDAGPLTAGMMLRRAREATGLHVAALAVSMKVPVRKLEALEADRLDELPDAVFARALAASACRSLKIDAAPVLEKLPQLERARLDADERGINAPYASSSAFNPQSLASVASKPSVMAVLALLLAALGVVFWPAADTEVQPAATATAPLAEPSPAPAPLAAEPHKDDGAGAQLVAATSLNMASTPVAAVSAPVAPAAALAPAAVPSVVAVAPAAATTPAPAASELLSFKARSAAWVRVSDARGAVQFEKTLAADETASVSGALPLSVVVGNAQATEVWVRGQAFSLDTVAKSNVARFEVK